MKKNLPASIAVAAAMVCLFWIFITVDFLYDALGLPGSVIFFVAGSVVLHFTMVRTGRLRLWTLPAGWLLCLAAAYIYVYHVDPGNFFGHGFAFTVLSVFWVLPSLVLSVVLAAVEWFRWNR